MPVKPPSKPRSTKSRRAVTPEERQLWREVTEHDEKLKPEIDEEKIDEMSNDISMEVAEKKSRKSQIATMESKPKLKNRPAPELGDLTHMDRRTGERFKAGRRTIDGTLDLHGMTSNRAHEALLAFVQTRYRQQARMLLIITGKGRMAADEPYKATRGVLKDSVPRWLAEPPLASLILAVEHAKPKDGGSGALYVLLRRERKR